jgi:molybdopterin molybdotransferase
LGSTAETVRHLSFSEARQAVLAAAPQLAERLGREQVPLADCLGRILASPLVANMPFPHFDNSAMDGYAVRHTDITGASPDKPVRLGVIETVAAGAYPSMRVDAGQAVRIMTGAAIPEGADCVVMREDTDEAAHEVRIKVSSSPGGNIRPAGEDAVAGETLLERGRTLTPGDVAVLAAFGHARVEVTRKPRVAILSTGDELRSPGEPLERGQIYDSNSFMLSALISYAGAKPAEIVRVSDDIDHVVESMRRLLAGNDFVFSLGGVSAGDFDVVKQSLDRFPGLELWRVGMRPGGPQAFGVFEGSVFYGLPGNPVSSAVVFDRLARPLLRTALGATQVDRPGITARLLNPVRSRLNRRDFLRVALRGAPGDFEVTLTGTQSSGAITSLSKADGLAVIPEERESVSPGEELEVILWQDI